MPMVHSLLLKCSLLGTGERQEPKLVMFCQEAGYVLPSIRFMPESPHQPWEAGAVKEAGVGEK